MTKNTDKAKIEQLGYEEATEQFKTQGCFSSGRTWENDDEANEAYDRGVNRAEAKHKPQAQHLPNLTAPIDWENAAHVAALKWQAERAAYETARTVGNQYKAHADKLAEALRDIADPEVYRGPEAMQDIAREALAAYEATQS